jgi:uncharacterized damage-inducible protein DinB
MALNPYAKFVGEQDKLAILAATPDLLHEALCKLTPEQTAAPIAPGKWSPCQIAAHLADCELVFSFRLRQTLAEDAPIVQPFDQDKWAKQYASYDLPLAMSLFCAARAWNMKLVAGLTELDYTRQMTHPERGTMTFDTLLETMAGHDLNHLRQVQAVARGAKD